MTNEAPIAVMKDQPGRIAVAKWLVGDALNQQRGDRGENHAD